MYIMKKNIFINIFVFLLSINVLFVSCDKSNNSGGDVDVTDTADKTTVPGIYKLNTLALPDGYKISSYTSNVNNVITHGDRIYAACKKTQKSFSDGQRRSSENSIIYSVDLEGGDEKIYPLEVNGASINSFDMDSEGNFYILAGFSTLYKLNPDGIPISQTEISEPGTNNGLKVDGNGKIYLNSQTRISIFNSDLEFLYDIETEYRNLSLHTAPDGKILAEDMNTGYTALPVYYTVSDDNSLKQTNIIKAPANVTETLNSYSVKFGEGYDIYFYNIYGVYGYNDGAEKADVLCDWLNSDLYFDYTRLISVISPDKMVCVSRDMFAETEVDGESVYDLIIMTRDNDAKPKITVTLAYINKIDEVLLAAINFNRLNDDYRIVFKDYTVYSSSENIAAGRAKFNMDLVSGTIPDIMLFDTNMPYYDYIDKGMFADLYKLFDGDSEMSRDDILYSVRSAYETDGKLYCLPPNFRIDTMTGKESLAGEEKSLTLDEFYGLYAKADAGASVCNISNNKNFLKQMLRANLGDFVDYESLTCSFDSEEFIKYIDFIRNLPVKKYDTNIQFTDSIFYSDYLEIKNNKLYLSEISISDLNAFISLKYVYGGDKYVIKGYPTKSTNVSVISSFYMFGISDSSECKNGAFEFLKYYLGDQMQTSDEALNGGLPVTVSALDILLDRAADTYFYVKEMTLADNVYLAVSSEYGLPDPGLDALYIKEGHTLYRFTEEDAKWLRDYLTESRFENKYDAKIDEIIWEELDLYFEGALTAAEAAKFIQNRVTTYISERYG